MYKVSLLGAALVAMALFTLPHAAFAKGGRHGGPAGRGNARHSVETVTTTVAALMGDTSADPEAIKARARTWCQTKVRGGGRIMRIELKSGGKVQCWYKQ
jgi:hypothetical protein